MAKITIKKKGKKPIRFEEGRLHRALGVPEDQPIPKSKVRAALAGRYGPEVKRMAVFAFKGALAKGRETARKHRLKKAAEGIVVAPHTLLAEALQELYSGIQ